MRICPGFLILNRALVLRVTQLNFIAQMHSVLGSKLSARVQSDRAFQLIGYGDGQVQSIMGTHQLRRLTLLPSFVKQNLLLFKLLCTQHKCLVVHGELHTVIRLLVCQADV